MDSNHSHDWTAVFVAWAFWVAGHVTLSNVALCVSIVVGLLQGYKTLRDIRKGK